MLFRKKISRACQYCSHGTQLNDEQVLCTKRGITQSDKSCRKFTYDPCKRVPPKVKASDFSQYNTEDFTL